MKNMFVIILGIHCITFAQIAENDSSLVQNDSLTTVYKIDKDDIDHLPVRDIPNYLKIMPGVQLEQGELYIRGGSSNENMTVINGAYLHSPHLYSNGLHIIPSALESITLYPGNYSAAYGWGTSALIDNQLRKGRPDFHVSLEFQTDKVVKQGETFLGTTSFGDQYLTLTIEGSLFRQNNRFFIAYENEDIGDTQKMFNEGFNLENRVDQNPFSPNAGQDTLDVVFPAGYTPKNWLNRHSVNARLDFDYQPVSFSLTGLYSYVEDYQLLTTAQDVFNDREQPHVGNIFYGSGELTWKINNKSQLKLQGGYLYEKHERQDDYFGNNWRSWSDSAAIARHTNNQVIYRDFYRPQDAYYLNGFSFKQNGTLNYDYSLYKNEAITGRVDYQILLGNIHKLNAGFETNYQINRMYSVNPSLYLLVLNEFAGGNEQNIEMPHFWDFVDKAIGYDFFGNESDDIEEPIKDLTGAVYLSDKIHWQNYIFDFGLRMDYYRRMNKEFYLKDPANPEIDPVIGMEIWDTRDYESQIKLNPRIGILYRLTEKITLSTIYARFVQTNNQVNGFEKVNQYTQVNSFENASQLGFSIHLSDFNIGSGMCTFFITDNEYALSSKHKTNRDVKGISFNFNSIRIWRFSTSLNYSYIDHDLNFEPKYISAVDPFPYNNEIFELDRRKHWGNALIEYRFHGKEGGKIFKNSGGSLLFNFASGVEYQKLEYVDTRSRPAVSSYPTAFTPWISTVDLKLYKTYEFSSNLETTLYLRITNLFNKQNVLNVYPFTGQADDDGYLDWVGEDYIQQYGGQDYIDMYRAVNLQGGRGYWSQSGTHLYGNPRQIMFGIKIAY